jgi:hypothetical protein
VQHSNVQLQAKVERLEREVGVAKATKAKERSEEEATLNLMHEEIKRLIAEK